MSLRQAAVGVPGNHEYYLEADSQKTSLTLHLRILNATGVTIAGLKIWGSPTTVSYGGAFGLSDPHDRVRHWAQIPDDVDILITHGPPAGLLDNGHGGPELLAAVQRARPKLHLFGHAHGAYGVVEQGGTTYVNAALLGRYGYLANQRLQMDFSTS